MLVRKRAMSSRWLPQQYVLGREPRASVWERPHRFRVQHMLESFLQRTYLGRHTLHIGGYGGGPLNRGAGIGRYTKRY